LRDEGEEYGRLLNQAGVPAEVVCYDGMIHGFAAMTVVERAVEIVKAMGQALRKGLA
jgi:acetyl esterase